MKKIIVTGAAGFIGGALTRKLLRDGYFVYGIDIAAEKLKPFEQNNNFIPIVSDFSQYSDLHNLVSDRDIYAFYNFAWAGSLCGSDLNDFALQTQSIEAACVSAMEASKLNVKKYIFISSTNQYLYNVDSYIRSTIYGSAKKAAQDMCYSICYKNNIDYSAAILTNTYGVGDHSHKAVNTFIKKMLGNEPIDLIEGNNLNDWMYIDETVNGLVSLLDEKNPFVYIGHNNITTFKEKLITMKKVLDSQSDLRFGKYSDNSTYDYSMLKDITINNDILQSIPFEESILKTAEWVKSLNWEV